MAPMDVARGELNNSLGCVFYQVHNPRELPFDADRSGITLASSILDIVQSRPVKIHQVVHKMNLQIAL